MIKRSVTDISLKCEVEYFYLKKKKKQDKKTKTPRIIQPVTCCMTMSIVYVVDLLNIALHGSNPTTLDRPIQVKEKRKRRRRWNHSTPSERARSHSSCIFSPSSDLFLSSFLLLLPPLGIHSKRDSSVYVVHTIEHLRTFLSIVQANAFRERNWTIFSIHWYA